MKQKEVEAMKLQNELVRAQLQDQVTRVSYNTNRVVLVQGKKAMVIQSILTLYFFVLLIYLLSACTSVESRQTQQETRNQRAGKGGETPTA
jgi:uncharacterized membrane protein (DUF106 family)